MKQLFKFVIMNLRRRQLRSYLTIIGIIVGVIAIVSLMSLSEGLKTGITSEFSKTGALKITISSKYTQFGQGSSIGLTSDDIKDISKVSGIDFSTGYLSSSALSEFNREEKFITLKSYDVENYEAILNQEGQELFKGKLITSANANEIVIGYDLYNSDEFYGKTLKLQDSIKINNTNYTVVGILKDTGNKSADRIIYFSIDNLRKITNTDNKTVDTILVIIKDTANIEDVGNKIEAKLENVRNATDFIVTTPTKAAKDREETLNVVSMVVIGIAAISLLVGGIGVLNSMYTSVLERRKEIGIMKAIGAKREDILKIFLLEAGIIGLIGGIIGTIGGFLISFAVNIIGGLLGTTITVSFSFTIVIIALSFSFTLGLLAGFLPAYQASKQQAIDSLREE